MVESIVRGATGAGRNSPRDGSKGFHAVDPFTRNSAAFAEAKIRQPSMFLAGTLDGLNLVAQPSSESMPSNLSDLHAGMLCRLRFAGKRTRSFTMLEGVGHWPHLEALDATNAALLAFLRSL
jgi:pimeloyl-ACP methyl ester carboxylesterase